MQRMKKKRWEKLKDKEKKQIKIAIRGEKAKTTIQFGTFWFVFSGAKKSTLKRSEEQHQHTSTAPLYIKTKKIVKKYFIKPFE